jgi:flagellar assembly protein FliH
MSSKLLVGGEAAQCEPMPWATVGSAASSSPSPSLSSLNSAPRAKIAGSAEWHSGEADRRESQETLRAKIAALEQNLKQAHAAGRAEGETQAKQAGQELQPVLQKLAAAIHESATLRARLREQAESDLVRLAIAIARKVVGREVSADPETITGVVKASLEKLRLQEVLRVKLNPEHKARIAEYLARFGASHVEVLGDPALAPGAVVFETTRGNLDASVETQLREIERGLTDRFKGKA